MAYRLDAVTLTRALNEIVRRHQTLRTVFRTIEDRPAQVVLPELKLDIPTVDLSDLSPDARETEAARLTVEESRRPFNLAEGPLLRATLLRLADADWIILLTIHHIVTDGWSMGLFFRELNTLYSAFAMGMRSPLPELEIQYADYAEWQRTHFSGDVLDRLLHYWKDRLVDLPALELPTDRPRPALQTFRGADHTFVLAPRVSAGLKALAHHEGATLFMTLLAAFKTLLYRYSGQQDIVVGSYIANRNHREIEPLIGFFVNTLVFRTDFSGAPTFRDVLRRVRAGALEAYAHQDIPFTKLVEELQPDRDLTRNPLFQVVFQLFNAPTMEGDEPREESAATPRERGTSIFDLALHTWEAGGRLYAQFEYNTDLFDAGTILRLTSHLETLLEAIATNPDAPVSALPLLSPHDQRRLTVEWNRTSREFPLHDGVVQLFEARAERDPCAVAFRCEGEVLTYSALNANANRIADALVRRGVTSGDMVGLYIERSLEVPAALLATWKAGAVYVPLDPSYPGERLKQCINEAGVRIVLTVPSLRSAVPQHVEAVELDGDGDELPARSTANPRRAVDPDALAYVIFTSGSTGIPKGVAVPHRQVLNRLYWMWEDYPWQPGEVGCQKTALNFVDSLWELLGGLLQGVPTVIIPDRGLKDVFELVDTLSRERVTRIWLVPSLLRTMLAAVRNIESRLPHLRFWVSSGEVLTSELFETFRQSVPGAVLFNLYGTSEVWDATWWDPRQISTTPYRIPIGRPIANVRTYVLDSAGRPVPVGVCGELYVAGAGLAAGYLDRNDSLDTGFVPNVLPEEPGAVLSRTGDFVRWLPDGNLEYVGRKDHQVKLRGHRISLEELECVANRCPGVEATACAIRADDNGEERLVAYVVASDASSEPGDDPVRSWQEVWDGVYEEQGSGSEPKFNTSGFVSSYTSQAIPAREVREWADEAAALVLSTRPARVLELGCGAGLLLFRVAPHCEQYVGTDFSAVAIDYVSTQLPGTSLPVEVRRQAADDFTGIPENAFDIVVLHSVSQYFPDILYLVRVLEKAERALVPGGSIMIGDVRHRDLLRAFHFDVQHSRAPSADPSDVWTQVERRVANERELTVSPAFFASLPNHLPRIASVSIEPKRGKTSNEFTQFRYNVLLHTATAAPRGDEEWIDWRSSTMTIGQLERLLRTQRPARLALANVANARVARAYWRAASSGRHDGGRTVEPDAAPGLDPAAISRVAESTGYATGMRWHIDEPDRFDLVVEPSNGSPRITLATPARPMHAWSAYANRPAGPSNANRLAASLRRHLALQVPEYMVPNVIMPLAALPLTPSGKVNRRGLPLPEWGRRRLKTPFVGPRNSIEQKLCELWSEILGVKQVGVTDDFFAELGGHSLMATRLVSRMRDTYRIEFPLRRFFEHPTVAASAEAIERMQAAGERSDEGIRPARREKTSVTVSGGFVESRHTPTQHPA